MASLNGKVVLFGGYSTGPLGDTWEWDGNTWTQRQVSGPSARHAHAMATLGNKIVLFGGDQAGGTAPSSLAGDTWEWDGNTWTQRNVAGPAPRSDFAMATLNGKIVLYGANGTGTDTWQWDGSTWTQVNVSAMTSSANPPPLGGESMANLGNVVVLFGGDTPSQAVNETWEWNGNAWEKHTICGPGPRFSFGMTQLGAKLVLFGGDTNALVALDDTWEFDGNYWTQRIVTTRPSGRYGFGLAARGTPGP